MSLLGHPSREIVKSIHVDDPENARRPLGPGREKENQVSARDPWPVCRRVRGTHDLATGVQCCKEDGHRRRNWRNLSCIQATGSVADERDRPSWPQYTAFVRVAAGYTSDSHSQLSKGRQDMPVADLTCHVRPLGRLISVVTLSGTVLPFLLSSASVAQPVEPPNGPRSNAPRAHALVNARIITEPGTVIEQGVILVRDGLITAVGTADQIPIPPDMRVWDLSRHTIHAGFIDPYFPVDATAIAIPEGSTKHWNPLVTPQRDASVLPAPDEGTRESLRSMGFTAVNLAPNQGIFRGSTALVPLGELHDDTGRARVMYVAKGPQVVRFQTAGWNSDSYPEALIGAIALTRQTFHDARWYNECWSIYAQYPDILEMPAVNDAYAALVDTLPTSLTGLLAQQPILFESDSELDFMRAVRLRDEFGLNLIVRGSGVEFKRINDVVGASVPIILPLNFPRAPKADSLADIQSVDLSRMLLWEQAPTNPRRLVDAGATVAFTLDLLRDRSSFFGNLRTAIDEGLTEEQALAAMTTVPASILGVADRLGSIASGKVANLVVLTGVEANNFGKDREVDSVWIDGNRFEVTTHPVVDPRGMWETTLRSGAGNDLTVKLTIKGESDKLDDLSIEVTTGEAKHRASAVDLRGDQISFILPAAIFENDEARWEQYTLTVTPIGLSGLRADINGQITSWQATRTEDPAPVEKGDEAAAVGAESDAAEDPAKLEEKDDATADDESADARPGRRGGRRGGPGGDRAGRSGDDEKKHVPAPETYPTPLGGYGLLEPPQAPTSPVLVTNATIWTSGPDGILNDTDILIENGTFSVIGRDLPVPATAMVIDAQGKHVTPGLIDCHSHTGIDRWSVNEGTQAVTAEVRISDVINPDDIDWYRQLAGGLTAANQLHGSANPIGGQNSVVKLRWGKAAHEFPVAGAIGGIKFALGENVKQSNWGDNFTSRYPQSRMGVEQIMRSEFQSARDYAAARARFDSNKASSNPLPMYPPARDLELDAVAEILAGTRLVHCHSYRQDEILMLIHVADDFGFTIGTFQHILEGYKVAQEIAAHGAGASAFSDWWAYKVEVYDAIPYAGALMHNAGVLVSFNSDSDELARRMNTEAAKAVRYGGVSPEEALKFVTINPAKQLRIDQQTGSIEKGKDADFVIWSGDPLSSLSRCEQTWIDGTCYFSLEKDAALRDTVRSERQRIIAKLLDLAHDEPEMGDDEEKSDKDGGVKVEGNPQQKGTGIVDTQDPEVPEWQVRRIEEFLRNRDFLDVRGHGYMTSPNVCGCGGHGL